MKRLVTIAVFACLVSGAHAIAAPGDPVWTKAWAVTGAGIGVDDGGAVSSAGTFGGAVDFGNGTVNSASGFDVFVVRSGGTGGHVWSGAFPPTVYVTVSAVAASPSGNTYVAGTLPKGGTIDFGGGPLGGYCWAVAFDPSGNHLWSDSYGQGVIEDIDATDTHVGFAARSFGTMNFGGVDLGTTGGNQAVAVLLEAPDGGHVWSADYGDNLSQGGLEVGLVAGNDMVFLARTRGVIDLGGGPLTPDADEDLVLARFDATGAHVWSEILHGTFGSFGSIINTGVQRHPVLRGKATPSLAHPPSGELCC